MNVLILTPDAVGSTLLQRLITIYMQFHEYDKPVINLHELTNGIEKYYSTDFNREILSKRQVKNWGYYQTLQQVVEMLSSTDHYKTSRLAQYHIKMRGDSLEQQIPFYRYLNDNFFIIACRRHNVFEHALSMTLSQVTKRLNVYSGHEKLEIFGRLYQDKIELDKLVLIDKLNAYANYLAWSQDHFSVASYFYYDEHLEHIEKYILDLPIFPTKNNKITWKDKFDIDFNDWNRCHHVTSDIGSLLLGQTGNQATIDHIVSQALLEHDTGSSLPVSNVDMPVSTLEREAVMLHSKNHQDFYRTQIHAYHRALDTIMKMRELDIIVSSPPIKKQTLAEKKYMIKNFDQCMDIYNRWADNHPDLAKPIDHDVVAEQIYKETEFWVRAREIVIGSKSSKPPSLL